MQMGHVATEPELRYTSGNSRAVCNAQFAFEEFRFFSQDDNDWKEKSGFIRIEVWGKSAESFNDHVKKGDNIFIEGHLGMDEWEDKKTKQKRQRIKIKGRWRQRRRKAAARIAQQRRTAKQ
jgi:single-strand DNA-binding protein